MNIYSLILSKRIDNSSNALDIYTSVYSEILGNLNEYPWSAQLCFFILRDSLHIENENDDKFNVKKASMLTKLKSKLKTPGEKEKYQLIQQL